MPGAGDDNNEVKTPPSGTEDNDKNEPGARNDEAINALKKEISDLRKEAAKYRTSAKTKESENQTTEQKLAELQKEIENTKRENITVKRVSALEKAGCIEAELIASKIPDDETDIKGWVDDYKKSHPSLFETEKPKSHGGGYKPSKGGTLSPSDQMNAFIRASAGRG